MDLRKKIKFTLIPLSLCLLLLISASYAWLTMSTAPEVTSVETNIGANGSLEIALLSDETYLDPLTIRATIGASAVKQDAVQSNLSWGNVIELRDDTYGIAKISLLPARLNLKRVGENTAVLNRDMLQIAQFGADGRISMLSAKTVSATYENRAFTYHISNQHYGVRAIGTIGNLTPQQIALSSARSSVQSNTTAAARAVKNVWRDTGDGIMEILRMRYTEGITLFDQTHVAAIRDAALKTRETLDYVDLALRQGIIGVAAASISDTGNFETLSAMISNTDLPLSAILSSAGNAIPADFQSQARQLDQMQADALSVAAACGSLSGDVSWEKIEPLLDKLVDADNVYIGEFPLSGSNTIGVLSDGSSVTLSPESGILAKVAEYTGNYSTYFPWRKVGSLEVRTADPTDIPRLVQVIDLLESSTAAAGGWTKSNLNDIYAMAIDMAFRCNVDSDLLLQTSPALRVETSEEIPSTQGGGSYMRFTSQAMDTEALLKLMDTIRVGFLNDRNELLGVAKLDTEAYEVQEEGVFAPLYLCRHTVQDSGALTIGEWKKADPSLLSMSRNIPAVVTVVVWLDGDYVDNSMVGHNTSHSMTGVMNLQFSSGADLIPANLPVKNQN